MKVWIGFSDGKPAEDQYFAYTHPDGIVVKLIAVFKRKKDALRCFEDVRRAELVIKPEGE